MQARFGGGSLGQGLVDPGGDALGVGARFERSPVLTEADVAAGDLMPGCLGARVGRRLGGLLGCFEFSDG
jgi:hypothetical protein